MIGQNIKSVILCLHRVDFRKGLNSLLAEAYKLELDPYEGVCLVFVNRKRDTIKCIFGDERGLYLCVRRFDAANAKIPFDFMNDPAITEMSQAELSLFLEGATISIHGHLPTC